MTTCQQVNAELRKRNRKERIRRGKGYFYIIGGDAESWLQSGIYVSSLRRWDIDSVISEIDELKRNFS